MAACLPAQAMTLPEDPVAGAPVASSTLPDAPEPQKAKPTRPRTPAKSKAGTSKGVVIPQADAASGAASVSGTVQDVSGAAVPNASVTLVATGQPGQRIVMSDSTGDFTFDALPPGMYKLTVVASGLETYVSNDIRLAAGERFALPPLELAVEPINSDITVVASQVQIAEAQLKLQEKQRIFGVIPNFYTSYIWDAAPLKSKQKFELTYKSLTDPVVFITTGIVAGVEQAHNTFPGYGSGPGSYFIRYASAYGDTITSRVIGTALLPSLLHQDPRYFYMGTGSVPARTYYAASRALITRGDSGKSQINISRIISAFGAAAVSNLYHAPEDRKAGLTVRNGFIILGSNAISNILREFISRKVTPNVPDYATGRPEGESGTQPVAKPASPAPAAPARPAPAGSVPVTPAPASPAAPSAPAAAPPPAA